MASEDDAPNPPDSEPKPNTAEAIEAEEAEPDSNTATSEPAKPISEKPASVPPEAPQGAQKLRVAAVAPAPRMRLVVPFVVAGWIFGAVEGALLTAKTSRGLVILFAAVLASILSGTVGVLSWAVAAAVARVPFVKRRLVRFGSAAEPDRDRWIRAYAYAAAALMLSVLAVVASKIGFPALFNLQEQNLAKQLAVVAGAGMVAGSLAGVVVIGRLVEAGMRAIDRRRKLPIPAPAWVLWLVLVALPVFGVAYPILRKYGQMLGRIRDAGTLVLVVVVGVQLWLLARTIPPRAAKIVARVLGAVAIIAIVGVGFVPKKRASTIASAEGSHVAALGGRLARWLTDFDRDGVSSMFGGLDCAPFDSRRAPNRPEIPGNGIDEDCDGKDTVTRVKLGDQELFSDALRTDQIKQYNIVWVIIETVRADHVSAIDYAKPTTPYLEKLGQESLVFTRAYSQASATVLSIPSMLSGVDPGMAEWSKKAGHPQLADSETLLAERLKNEKYKTALVYDTYLKHSFFSIQRGFDDLLLAEPDSKNVNNRPRRNLYSTAKASEFLAHIKPDDHFFLTVYYPDPHSPYTRHKDVDTSKFDAGELGDYDTELAWTDQQLRALVEMLKARPAIWDNTILVINADHGEEFGEHGGVRHAITCYNEVVHVPLIVRIPGIPAQRIDARVGLVDVVPTILELLGHRENLDHLAGQSLLMPALRPERLDANRPLFCNIASITNKYGTFFRRAVRDSKYTLIHDVNAGQFSLYDSENDLFEHEDLALRPEFAGQLQAMKGLLEASFTGNLRDHTRMKYVQSGGPREATPPNSHDDSGDEPE